ncbi:hypothetical protein KI387_018374, partial [Taxus chinensis]
MMSPNVSKSAKKSPSDPRASKQKMMEDNKELHMFVWSSSASPVSEANHHVFGRGPDFGLSDNTHNSHAKEARMLSASPINAQTPNGKRGLHEARTYEEYMPEEFSFGHRGMPQEEMNHKEAPPPHPTLSKFGSSSTAELNPKGPKFTNMPPASVMTRLILIMVWRKLIRNPNTYSSLIGLAWSLITFRWKIEMP